MIVPIGPTNAQPYVPVPQPLNNYPMPPPVQSHGLVREGLIA